MALPTSYRQVSLSTPPSIGASHRYGKGSSVVNKGDASAINPFSNPSHGNPSFNPQKISGAKISISASEVRIPKPPKAPDKPLMPYMRYSRKVWDQVKATHQDLKLWEIGKIIGSLWRELPEADKQDFVDEYESEKVEYEKALKAYHASPSYQAYLNAKAKGTSIVTEEKEVLDRSTTNTTTTLNTKLDRRIDIQPAEDEDEYDEGLSVKHVAHARYLRNHRLINEIFSDTVVPDVRTVVTSQRLTVLRRQVQSLTMHQKKLEHELTQIEDKFEGKKRKLMEAGKKFQVDLKKVKLMSPKLDDASFALLVEKQKEILKKEAEERQKSGSRPSAAATTTASSICQPVPQNWSSSGADSGAEQPSALPTAQIPIVPVQTETSSFIPSQEASLQPSLNVQSFTGAEEAPLPSPVSGEAVSFERKEETYTYPSV